MGLRPMEILLILIVVLLLFGTSRLPQLGQSLGSAIRNFKKGFQGGEEPAEGDAAKNAQPQQLAGTTQGKEAGAASTTSAAQKNS